MCAQRPLTSVLTRCLVGKHLVTQNTKAHGTNGLENDLSRPIFWLYLCYTCYDALRVLCTVTGTVRIVVQLLLPVTNA